MYLVANLFSFKLLPQHHLTQIKENNMLQIRKAEERGKAHHGWLESYHTFSFANYYDRNYMSFSDLRVINEDFVAPTMGFATHPHKDMEILSYVLEGTIAHKDSMGNVKTFEAGEFQIMSAGTGIFHSEYNPSTTERLHFLQIWIMPNELGISPRYAQKKFPNQEGATLILSPNAENGSFQVYQNMKLWRYQFSMGKTEQISLNKQRKYWLQMMKGNMAINGQIIHASDAIAISAESSVLLEMATDVEFLLFDLR